MNLKDLFEAMDEAEREIAKMIIWGFREDGVFGPKPNEHKPVNHAEQALTNQQVTLARNEYKRDRYYTPGNPMRKRRRRS